jgi:hypothetical protein
MDTARGTVHRALANVRYGAHYGLMADIARGRFGPIAHSCTAEKQLRGTPAMAAGVTSLWGPRDRLQSI